MLAAQFSKTLPAQAAPRLEDDVTIYHLFAIRSREKDSERLTRGARAVLGVGVRVGGGSLPHYAGRGSREFSGSICDVTRASARLSNRSSKRRSLRSAAARPAGQLSNPDFMPERVGSAVSR